MKAIFLAASISCALLVSCERSKPAKAAVEEELTGSLNAALGWHRDRPVFVVFVSNWDANGWVFRRALRSPQAKAAFDEHGVAVIVADLTERPDLFPVLPQLGLKTVPSGALYCQGQEAPIWVDHLNYYYEPERTGSSLAGIVREQLANCP